jgi:2,4-dichlorophenol 6-monooxygenase
MGPEEVDARLEQLFGPEGGDQRAELLAGLDIMNWQFNAHGVELGQRYRSSAVVDDGEEPPVPGRDPELYYEPTTRPGSPVPHAWLVADDVDVSTLDLCSYDRFTLITGAAGRPWVEAAATVSAQLGVEIAGVAVSLGLRVNDVYGHWIGRREVGDEGCVLVRPDRIVAWRSVGSVPDPVDELRRVMEIVLGHHSPGDDVRAERVVEAGS